MDYSVLARELAPYLAAWMPTHDGTRDLGRGTAFPTSSIPGGLQTSDRFFRTDLGYQCYYDGTRWLTTHEYDITILPRTLNFSAAQSAFFPIRQDWAVSLRYALYAKVSTTNNASNYWQLFCQSFNLTITANDNPHVVTTIPGSVGVWTDYSGVANTTPIPSNHTWLAIQAVVGAGAPGQLDLGCTAYYRLIVT